MSSFQLSEKYINLDDLELWRDSKKEESQKKRDKEIYLRWEEGLNRRRKNRSKQIRQKLSESSCEFQSQLDDNIVNFEDEINDISDWEEKSFGKTTDPSDCRYSNKQIIAFKIIKNISPKYTYLKQAQDRYRTQRFPWISCKNQAHIFLVFVDI